jgi:hypothetical protein
LFEGATSLTLPVPDEEISVAALTVWTSGGGLLSILAPIGLAVAAGTALLVDLDSAGPSYWGTATLADLVRAGPRRDDLRPQVAGPAVLANGGIEPDQAGPVIRALTDGWPSVVLRSPEDRVEFAPIVPVYPLLPGAVSVAPDRFCVFQRTGFETENPQPGITLPCPRRQTIQSLLTGSLPVRSRWFRAWSDVWRHPWI